MNEEEKKTPLYDMHVKYGGRMVPFAGYLLPVQYGTGIVREHMAVRTACGIFDVSHMGEILCQGPDALANLNMLLTNSYSKLKDGRARYSPMCNEKGGVVDDLIVYKVRDNSYLIVVNAANRAKDYAWMKSHRFGEVTFTDISDSVAQIALQGPSSMEVLRKLVPEESIPAKYYSFNYDCAIDGVRCLISRTGYTGEDGVEIYTASRDAEHIWEILLENGKEEGLIPCGLGARDTLRMEAGMPLYGQEMDETITPEEAGLGTFVKMDKEDFIGKKAMEDNGSVTRKRVGLEVTGRGIIREHQAVYEGSRQIGWTTSGTHCPYLGRPVAMAILDVDYTEPGTEVEADVRGKRVAARVVPLPFYKSR